VLYWLMLGLAVGASQNCAREAKQIKARRAAKSQRARRRSPAGRRSRGGASPAPRLTPAG